LRLGREGVITGVLPVCYPVPAAGNTPPSGGLIEAGEQPRIGRHGDPLRLAGLEIGALESEERMRLAPAASVT
jgi:hypothetical protein